MSRCKGDSGLLIPLLLHAAQTRILHFSLCVSGHCLGQGIYIIDVNKAALLARQRMELPFSEND